MPKPRFTPLLLLFLFIIPTYLLPKTQNTILTYYKGTVSIYRNKTLQQPEIDMNLLPGDSLETGSNSTLEIRYEDGSVSSLEPNSIIKINSAKKEDGLFKTAIKAWLGSVLCKIKKLHTGETFEVYTPTAVASVRGTVFEAVVKETQETSFNVLAGELYASSLLEGARTYILKDKFKYFVGRDGVPDIRKLSDKELKALKSRASAYIRNFIEETKEEIEKDIKKKVKKGCLGFI